MADSSNRTVPWLRVLVEGVVIVGSILLAFGLQAWWEGLQEDARASEYMTALLEEVSVNLQELDETTRYTEGAIVANRSVRRLFVSGWTEVPKDSVLYLFVRAGAINVLSPVTNIHDQLVATGDLRLLSRGVRDALSAWQRALRRAEYQDRYQLDFRTNSGDPYFLNETAFAEFVISYFQGYDTEPVRFETDVEQLSTDRRLDNILIHQMLLNGARLRSYEPVQDALRALDEVLRRDLNGESATR